MKNKKPRTKRICVTVPISWKEQIDRQAALEGRTRSSYITWLVRRYLAVESLKS
jgi:metal-responsive CopG/Arc/MetJ family transcriptional regulator